MRAVDKSARWLTQNCAEALLQVVRGRRVVHWETISPSLVHIERTPDGLLGALFEGETEPEQTLLEITTYAKTDVGRQCLEDIALARVALGHTPETVVLVLAERPGPLVTPTSREEWSPRRTTKIAAEWVVIHAWELPADDILRRLDPEQAPWAVLADYGNETPEAVVRRTRQVIDRAADDTKRRQLLAVSQTLLRLRYNEPGLLELLGGTKVLIESPLIAELAEEWYGDQRRREVAEAVAAATAAATAAAATTVLRLLRARFGPPPADVAEAVRAEQDMARLSDLTEAAALCADIAEFRTRLWPN